MKNQNGYIILFSLAFMGIMLLLSAALMGYTTLNLKSSRIFYVQNQALYLAEAGIDKAIYQLNQSSSYTGESNTALGPGEFTVTVATIDSNTKRITATGYVPNSSKPTAVKTIKANATIDTTMIAFNNGVQVGLGGLQMDNNSKIIGNVFSNGNITGGNGSTTNDIIIAVGTSGTPDEQWAVHNNDFSFGNTSSRHDVAQSFKPSVTNTLNKAQFYIKKVGNPGDLTAILLTDDSGDPSRTDLASANIAASLVTTSYGWIEAAFSGAPNLTSGTTYWLMLSAASINSSNYYVWGSDNNNGYGNGVGKYSDNWDTGNPSWTDVGGDLNYKTFMGGVTTYFDAGIKVGGNLTATEIRDCGEVMGTAYYGSVFNSCTASSTVSGSTAPGPEPMPISQAQIDDWKQTAEDEDLISGNYTISGTETLGPIKIDGDLTLGNSATLYLTGPVWVKGNILIDNLAAIRMDASLGNTGTVLLADNLDNPSGSGIVNIYNNAIVEGNGNPNSYPVILTTSTNNVAAMTIANNSTAAIYYAPNGTIEVSQNAGANQITANKIHLDENAVITYQNGLQNAGFSNGPGGSWAFLPGSYVIEP